MSVDEEEDIPPLKGWRKTRNSKRDRRPARYKYSLQRYWPKIAPSLSKLKKPCPDLTNPDLVPSFPYCSLEKKKSLCILLLFLFSPVAP